jgi:two-component system alkaline phosphatase synthesis response regulator PhoP
MQKILIIEDDSNIRELVIWNLSEEGYDCISTSDGKEGLGLARRESPDLILLDLMLPSMDGFEVVRALRTEGIKTPVIMLTAKSDEADKVIGLEFGADDYITKPFGIRELKARIKAMFRRYKSEKEEARGKIEEAGRKGEEQSGKSEEQGSNEIFEFGDLLIDVPCHEVRVNGENVVLTLKEFELLHMLAQNRGRVLTRDRLLESIWGYEYPGETRTVDVHVRYLRRKLGAAGDRITTVRGLGYKLL